MTKKSFFGIIVAIIAVIGFFIFLMNSSANNHDNYLRNEAKAQNGQIENVYDQMWKVLNQEASVADEYKNAFKEIYPQLIAGRYSNGNGQFMQWITEQNPKFDTSLYVELMKKIEVLRNQFMLEQKKMLDIVREHDNLLTTIPSKWFVNNTERIEYVVISSTHAKQVMETRVDDDIDLFKSKEK